MINSAKTGEGSVSAERNPSSGADKGPRHLLPQGEKRRQDYPISVNCKSSVRWSMEKLSSEIIVSTVSPSAVT